MLTKVLASLMSDCTDRAIIWPILFEMCNHCCGPGDQSGLVHRAADVVGEFGWESLAQWFEQIV